MATIAPPLPRSPVSRRPALGWRDNLVTMLLGSWLVVGVFVDGWAHENLRRLETFFTPWHGLLYSGYLATALWMVWVVGRGGRRRLEIPAGYALGLAGVGIFAVGGVGDLLWHVAFGVERGLDALLSPTHLTLFLGGTLIVTAPLRSAWLTEGPLGGAPSLKALLPALLSITAATVFTSFMTMYLWAFNQRTAFHALSTVRGSDPTSGLASIFVTNVLLLAPALLLLRRWRLPFGSVTLVFTFATALMAVLHEFRQGELVAVGLLTGLGADGLIRSLRPTPGRPLAFHACATAIPALLWSLYFLVEHLRWGLAWSTELWGGAIVLAALSGLALSVLMAPPEVPTVSLGE